MEPGGDRRHRRQAARRPVRRIRRSGTADAARDAVEWAREAESRGAGEILLTSMDRDGTKIGIDCEMTAAVSDAVDIPGIASGGAGTLEHSPRRPRRPRRRGTRGIDLHDAESSVSESKQFLHERRIRDINVISGARGSRRANQSRATSPPSCPPTCYLRPFTSRTAMPSSSIQGERLAIEAPIRSRGSEVSPFPRVQLIDLDGPGAAATSDDLRVDLPAISLPGRRRHPQRRKGRNGTGGRRTCGYRQFVAFRNGAVDWRSRQLAATIGAERIIAAVDRHGGQVAIDGWKTTLPVTAVEAVRALSPIAASSRRPTSTPKD